MSEFNKLGGEGGAKVRTVTNGFWELSPSSNTGTRFYSEDEMIDLYDLLSDEFGDSDEDDTDGDEGGGPATELLDSIYYSSMNTRPLDELFTDYGRVMADNDRDHDRVVTMSDVEAEIQSLAERVTELEGQQ